MVLGELVSAATSSLIASSVCSLCTSFNNFIFLFFVFIVQQCLCIPLVFTLIFFFTTKCKFSNWTKRRAFAFQSIEGNHWRRSLSSLPEVFRIGDSLQHRGNYWVILSTSVLTIFRFGPSNDLMYGKHGLTFHPDPWWKTIGGGDNKKKYCYISELVYS